MKIYIFIALILILLIVFFSTTFVTVAPVEDYSVRYYELLKKAKLTESEKKEFEYEKK